MKFYKEIELDNFEVIVGKCIDFIKNIGTMYTWNKLDHLSLLNTCPELVSAFRKYNLECTFAAAYVVAGNGLYSPPPHIDSTCFSLARINLPLLNCKNTFTEFFSNVHARAVRLNAGPLASYMLASNTDYILEDRIELSKATVIRVSEPHRVSIPATGPRPRITLTLDFHRDPIYMLEQ